LATWSWSPEQSEITAALALLRSLPLDGAVIKGDVIVCQRAICEPIRDGRSRYLFVVKQNLPVLHATIAESFGDLSPLGAGKAGRLASRPDDLQCAGRVDKAHGRIEVWRAEVSAEVVASLT
jgi:hypothetical protein